MPRRHRILSIACFLLAVRCFAQGEVTVYCSLDQDFSSAILDRFEKETGIRVNRAFDAEQDKTVGMVNRILSERDDPRGDVYWNNEVGQTIRLQNQGLLQPYVSPMAAGIPAGFKDAGGHWTGLAARARVFIYNRDLLGGEAPPKSLEDLVDPKWKGKVAMARPLTGTTLTNLAALFTVWGEARTKDFVERLLSAGIAWQGGNAMVMREVGQGAFVWGFTDTDDANVSMKVKGHPTAVSIPDQGEGGMGTLFIPNSVAILAGARNLDNAKKLVDFILSPAVETALAEGPSAQIPLREGLAAPEAFAGIRPMAVDWTKVGPAIEKYEPWLRERFTGGGERAGDKGSAAAIVIGVLAFVAVAIVIGRKSAVK